MISCIGSHIKIGLVRFFFSFFPNFVHDIQCQQQEWAYPTVQVSWVLMVTTEAHQPGCSPTGPEQGGVAIVAGSTSSLGQVRVMIWIQEVQLGGNSRGWLRNKAMA